MPRLISDKYREVQLTMLNRFNQLKANEEALNRVKRGIQRTPQYGKIMSADSVSPAFAGR